MEQQTKIQAENGKLDLHIHRIFQLPAELLFKAYVEAQLIEQWMGTKVLKWDCRKHGAYQMQTLDQKGNIAFQAHGVIHELIPQQKIVRTFEMENTPFGVQLEIYTFKSISPSASELNMHVIYESVEQRDQVLKLPFAYGINMAHDRIQKLMLQG